MKSQMSFLFGLVLMLFSASVGYAQNDDDTISMADGQTIYIDGNLNPRGTVIDAGGTSVDSMGNFEGYVVISADTGMVIHLSGQYYFRYLGKVAIWDGDTNGEPLYLRQGGMDWFNVTARSGMLTIGLYTDSLESQHRVLQVDYTVDSAGICSRVNDLLVQEFCTDCEPMRYVLFWQQDFQPDYWEVEYGPHGFELGTGEVLNSNDNGRYFYDFYTTLYGNALVLWALEWDGLLQGNTLYDFYVRPVCEVGVYGEWDSVSYRTNCAMVEELTLVDDNIRVNADNLIDGYMITWVDAGGAERWVVAIDDWNPYSVTEPMFNLPSLAPNAIYQVRVNSDCGNGNYGQSETIIINTNSIGITEADASSLSVSPNPANGRCMVSLDVVTPAELKLYGTDGRLLQTIAYKGTPIELQLPSQGVYLLQATTAAGTMTRKIVNK